MTEEQHSIRTFASSIRPFIHGSFRVVYSDGLRALPRRALTQDPAPDKPRPNMPFVVHEMLVAVSGVIVEKWEKVSVWVLAAFAAVSGAALSNYSAVVERFGEGAVRHIWWSLLASTLLLAVQKGATTFVQAFEAGHKAGKAMDLDPMDPDDFQALKDGMVAAYPKWPGLLLARLFKRMETGGLAPMSKTLMRATFVAVACTSGQLLVGLVAIVRVGLSLG